MIKLDAQQQKIVDSTSDKICVIAGAGSGKTGTTIERIRKLLREGADPRKMVFITFTKMAAQEMQSRLSDTPGSELMFIGTIHAYAYNLLARAGIRANLLTNDKERELTKTLISKYAKFITMPKYEKWAEKQRLMELGYFKQYEVDNMLTADEATEIALLLDHVDLKSLYSTLSAEDVDKVVSAVLKKENHTELNKYPESMRSLAKKLGYISFNAMLEECSKHNVIPDIEYLFVDEFQDVGAFEYKFLMNLNAKNIFVVGDDYQCQPGFTTVLMADGSAKCIRDIQIGDRVVSWDMANSKWTSSAVKVIQQTASDRLIKVSTDSGKATFYTFNHKCYTAADDGSIGVTLAGNLSVSDVLLSRETDGGLKHEKVTSISLIVRPEEATSYTTVYCLDVEGTHNYVADGILTHNSIYSFKGSDFEYFKKLVETSGYTTYKMENNYRCQKHIVDFGEKIISQIHDVIPKKCVSKVKPLVKGQLIYKEGNIKTVEDYLKLIDHRDYGKWFILTRSNNDMVDISRMCYHINLPTVTFKKSGMSKSELDALLAENSLKILTVHAAKGLESDNVLLYGEFPLDDSSHWERKGTEECRIFYVGATRARNNLIVVSNHNCKPYSF